MALANIKSASYPHLESKYEKIFKKQSSKPFCVETGSGKLWYYLSCSLNKEYMKNNMSLLHNCRTCASRVENIGSLFGPDGFAIPMGGVTGRAKNDIFIDMEMEREQNKSSLSAMDTFFVTKKNIERYPRLSGVDPNGKSYYHIAFNIHDSQITKGLLATKIDNNYTQASHTADPAHFDSETRLEDIITSLQKPEDGKSSFMTTLDKAFKSRDLKRKNFWEGHLEYISAVQNFSSKFKNGTTWCGMDDISKAHVRIFARFYGGSQALLNTRFKGAGQIIDCFKDVGSDREISSLVSFMNSRSDPATYMVQQISQAVEKHAVKSRYKVSLAWSTTDDLDLWVRTSNGESIGFSNKMSKDRETRLDFDANAGNPSTNPVENISLSDKKPGSYVIYVNNYSFRCGKHDIPFTVIVSMDGYDKSFTGVWPKHKNQNTASSLGMMLNITTARVTSEMLSSNKKFEMSDKLSKKFDGIKGDFVSKFGEISSIVIDMKRTSGAILPSSKPAAMNFLSGMAKNSGSKPSVTKPRTSAEIARDSQIGNMRKIGTFNDIIAGFESMTIGVRIHVRDFPPAYLTIPVGSEENIKYPFVANTYYEEGRAPRKPDPDAKDVCRINNKWLKQHYNMASAKVSGLLKIDRPEFSGYFMSVENMVLPESCERDWVIGGGMYPTDLKSEYHLYRDIWHAHHAITAPSNPGYSSTPAIGVFLHTGKTYQLQIDGCPRNVKIC